MSSRLFLANKWYNIDKKWSKITLSDISSVYGIDINGIYIKININEYSSLQTLDELLETYNSYWINVKKRISITEIIIIKEVENSIPNFNSISDLEKKTLEGDIQRTEFIKSIITEEDDDESDEEENLKNFDIEENPILESLQNKIILETSLSDSISAESSGTGDFSSVISEAVDASGLRDKVSDLQNSATSRMMNLFGTQETVNALSNQAEISMSTGEVDSKIDNNSAIREEEINQEKNDEKVRNEIFDNNPTGTYSFTKYPSGLSDLVDLESFEK